jgi:hypothetical protein
MEIDPKHFDVIVIFKDLPENFRKVKTALNKRYFKRARGV